MPYTSNNEYLESILRKSNLRDKSNQSNHIKSAIITYFHKRELITLNSPLDNIEDLNKLIDFPFEHLNYSFKMEFINLKDSIYMNSHTKKIKGIKMNGVIIANIIETIVNSINNDSDININKMYLVIYKLKGLIS